MAKNFQFSGEILHCVGTRFRATGIGELQLNLRGLDNLNITNLANLTLQSTTNREPVVLANFKDQSIQLELKTTEINEFFKISKIVFFVKPTATGYPQ